jgi:hypothetical protein
MKPVIRSGHFFLISDQGHILSNSFECHKLEILILQKITKLQNLTKFYLSRPKVVKFTTMTVLHFDCQYLLIL